MTTEKVKKQPRKVVVESKPEAYAKTSPGFTVEHSVLDLLRNGSSELSYALAEAVHCPASRLQQIANIPHVEYKQFMYAADKLDTLNSTMTLICEIAGVVEDAVLVFNALEQCQRNVLVFKPTDEPQRLALDGIQLTKSTACSGIVLSMNQILAIVRGMCVGHQDLIDAICVHEHNESRAVPSKRIMLAAVVVVQDLLECTRDRANHLYNAGALGVTDTLNCTRMIDEFLSKEVCDLFDSDEHESMAVQNNIYLNLVGAALRIHNTVCATLALNMAQYLYPNLETDFPVVNKVWVTDYVKEGK